MKANYVKFEEDLEVLLAQDVIEEWRELTKGQYRINECLDIYPRYKRYCFPQMNERGDYQNLEDLIYLLFK